jgi:tRNA(fMet)-specific endonuclease VapC
VNPLIVDTSVVSYLLKGHSLADPYQQLLRGHVLFISFMTVAELYRWPLERNWGERRIATLREHLRSYTVIPYDDELSWEWARIKSRKGRPISHEDAWIAATAVSYDAPLVTHNPRHFIHIDRLQIVTIPRVDSP